MQAGMSTPAALSFHSAVGRRGWVGECEVILTYLWAEYCFVHGDRVGLARGGCSLISFGNDVVKQATTHLAVILQKLLTLALGRPFLETM
jgi:hypothetical protein